MVAARLGTDGGCEAQGMEEAMSELNREELQYGNYKCPTGNPLWIVAEGYARCSHSETVGNAWKYGQHKNAFWRPRRPFPFSCWTDEPWDTSIEEILAYIQADIDRENAQGTVAQPVGPTLAEWREMQKTGAAR